MRPIKKPDIFTMQTWVYESQLVFREWRSESWTDCGFYDGGKGQWLQRDWEDAKAAGIDPITVNRIFPVVNLIMGSHLLNRLDIMAKGRTQKDGEISQVMSEGLRFVMDQNGGDDVVSQAFKDALIPGFGCTYIGTNNDPRKEKIKIAYRPWAEIWWDPYASPWFNPDTCRYVFHQRWIDLTDLQALFPNKSKEIEGAFWDWTNNPATYEWGGYFDDEAMIIEDKRRLQTGMYWADAERKRIRPVELWYTVWDTAWFAKFSDGRVIEISEHIPALDQYEIIQNAQEIVSAVIRRMRVCTFVGDIILQDSPTPFEHHQFPFVPFVGYLDRYGFPYGLPRQLAGQNIEINKRRSMALQLLKTRRVKMTEDAVPRKDGDGQASYQRVYEEVNKPDGMVIVRPGHLNDIEIDEHTDLAPAQVELYRESEREIGEISGSNQERMGIETNAISGAAIEVRQRQGSMMTAEIFENRRRSMRMIGEQIMALIQSEWTGEKVLRVTDRLTGSERFVALNQLSLSDDGTIEVQNDITQGRFDLIIAHSPATDSVRQTNMLLLMETIKKAPPEAIPHLWVMAMELSDIPNKEELLTRIKPLFGLSPEEEGMSPEELKQYAMQKIQTQQAEVQKQAQFAEQAQVLELEKLATEIKKTLAEIANIEEEGRTNRAKAISGIEAEQRRASATEKNVDVNEFRAETEADGRVMEAEQSRMDNYVDLQKAMIKRDEAIEKSKQKREAIK